MLQTPGSMLHQIEGQCHVWPYHLHMSTVNHSDYLFLYSRQPHKTHVWFHAVLHADGTFIYLPIQHIIAFNTTGNKLLSSIRMAWPVSLYVSICVKTFGEKLYSAFCIFCTLLLCSLFLCSLWTWPLKTRAVDNMGRSGEEDVLAKAMGLWTFFFPWLVL